MVSEPRRPNSSMAVLHSKMKDLTLGIMIVVRKSHKASMSWIAVLLSEPYLKRKRFGRVTIRHGPSGSQLLTERVVRCINEGKSE